MDLDRTLNILDLIKRMRMHGFALTCLWDNDSRKFFSHQAHNKHIDEVKSFKPKTLWQKYDGYSKREQMAFNLFKKFQNIHLEGIKDKKQAKTAIGSAIQKVHSQKSRFV